MLTLMATKEDDLLSYEGLEHGYLAASPSRRLAPPAVADSCFFRSGPKPGHRKALLKVTDRCDLGCAHCFVSATAAGSDMPLDRVRASLSRLAQARVSNVTLTGGEPFIHPHLLDIARTLVRADIEVTICTNAVEVEAEAIRELAGLGRVTINVSLDGATAESHGRFRGDRKSFERTLANTRRFAEAGVLKGILSTPNRLAADHEYAELYGLAQELGVDYLLMNPLSKFGRGVGSITKLRKDNDSMKRIQSTIPVRRNDDDPEQVFIRFPNESRPLSNCIAGDIFYVSVNGDAAVCPYLLFAAKTPGSLHSPEEFTFGNLFDDADFADRLGQYNFHDRYAMGTNESCTSCPSESACGKGCPAAVVAAGGRIGDLDSEVCPETE